MAKNLILTVFLTGTALLTGCAQQPAYKITGPLQTPKSTAETIKASEQALRQMGFRIDKLDTEKGYIRTLPLRGTQFFEFWRKDNAGTFNTTEANIQNLRRTVELEFTGINNSCQVKCTVNVERLSLEEIEAYGGHRAATMFAKGSSGRQKLKLYKHTEKQWIQLGQDKELAARILGEINKKLENN